MKLETGDILHCNRKGILSFLIRKATKSNFNHSAIVVEIWGQIYIIDSQRDGTDLRPFDVWTKKYKYTYKISRNIFVNRDEFAKRALSRVDTGYDFTSLLIRKPLHLIFGRWKKKEDETKRFYCSEFAAWCHKIERSDIMTPNDLYNYCQEHGEYFREVNNK